MGTYSIKDLEQLSGIKAHTLRIWEQRYGILKPDRTATNIRTYNDAELKLLLNISLLNTNGYKISRIADMSANEIMEEVRSLNLEDPAAGQQISMLTLALTELDEARFDQVIAAATLRYGLEQTMQYVVYPFLERIGVLWLTGSISVAQEHFMSNLIRQKIISATDSLPAVHHAQAPRFVLYLPEGEMHELSLLFAAYMLKARNCRVMYLGSNLPEVDLEQVCDHLKPRFILTLITVRTAGRNVPDYLFRVANRFPFSTLLAAGQAVQNLPGKPPANLRILKQLTELLPFAEAEGRR